MTQPATQPYGQPAAPDGLTVVRRLFKGFFWIVFIGLILAFLINVGIGGYFVYRTNQFINKADRVEGRVIRLEPPASSSTSPVIEFFDLQGNPHEFRSSISSSPPMYEVGEKVPVFYDPANPFDARIDSFFSLWLIPFIFGVVASVILLILLGFSCFALILRWAFRSTTRTAAPNA